MIRSILTLKTDPARAEQILALYRVEGILEESLELTRGVASEISVATDGSGEIMVTALWPDEAAYQEWLDHPKRERAAPNLRPLLSHAEIGVGKLFRVDHEASAS